MRWSLRLGRIAGIVVQVHVTFFLLLVWIAYRHLAAGEGIAAAAQGVMLVLAVFACVVLHEFGHALTARRFGIATRDITLLPIGGVARLDRIPDEPSQELAVALAGPAVNVAIAALLFGALAAVRGAGAVLEAPALEGDLLVELVRVNVLLALFNMVPAFPMDGGRVLRAFLAMRIDRRRATQAAAFVGQGIAILFGILGLMGNPILVLIALFIYLGAQSEAEMAGTQELLRGRTVRDAMVTRFRTLPADATLALAVEELLAGSQQDFPVVEEGRLIGVLGRNDLVRAVREGSPELPIRSALRGECASAAAGEPLRDAIERMRAAGCSTLPVLDEGRIAGLLTLENIAELLMLTESVARREPARS